MKNKIYNRILAFTGAMILLSCFSGCKDMFVDPLKDKNTGGTVTLLLIDRNFIKTKFYVKVVDYASGADVTSEPVKVYFLGADSAHLISFAGEKKSVYTTSSAFIEVGYDPSIEVSKTNPVEFTVIAASEHYISTPVFNTYTSEGVKNITIKMVHKGGSGPGLKAAFDEPYDLKYNGILASPGLKYQISYRSDPTGTNFQYLNLYESLAAGRASCSNLKDPVMYSDYGVFYFNDKNPTGLIFLLPPSPPSKDVALPVSTNVYSSIKRTGQILCNSAMNIHVDGPEGGSGTFNYRIDFSDGAFTEGSITCEFPCDRKIEQIYYPVDDESVSVTLLGDAQYNMSDAVGLTTPCGETASFTATPKSNLKTYKFITLYTCPDNPVGIALSIRGQFHKSGTSDTWTDFSFIGGICELRLEPGLDYDMRVNIDGEYHAFTLPTDPTRIAAVLREGQSIDYTIKSLDITTTALMITVNAIVQFSSGVCDMIK